MRKGKQRKRDNRDCTPVKEKKHLSTISTSAEVIAQVIFTWWINAQPTAQVNIVTDIQLQKKKQPSIPTKTNIKLISAEILLHNVKKQTNANYVFVNGGKRA